MIAHFDFLNEFAKKYVQRHCVNNRNGVVSIGKEPYKLFWDFNLPLNVNSRSKMGKKQLAL